MKNLHLTDKPLGWLRNACMTLCVIYLFDLTLLELVLLTLIPLPISVTLLSCLTLDGGGGLALACKDLAKLLTV